MTNEDQGRTRPDGEALLDPGSDAAMETPLRTQDRETRPPAGSATGAGGGYGVGSDGSSGGSGEPTADGDARTTSAEDETDWLRSADGGPSSPGAD